MSGQISSRKQRVVDTFKERGAPPSKVASAIIDAVRTNPAVRLVGADAKVLAALTRVAPQALNRLAGSLQRRFGVP
jgi:hypothetical protein